MNERRRRQAACMEETRDAYDILVWNTKEQILFGRPRRMLKYNVKNIVKK
jgi:hypothetical protein